MRKIRMQSVVSGKDAMIPMEMTHCNAEHCSDIHCLKTTGFDSIMGMKKNGWRHR